MSEPVGFYLNLQKPIICTPVQHNNQPNNRLQTRPRTTPTPVVYPVPPRRPNPVPPTPPTGTTPKPPQGRQPGDNPGGSGRNKPKPNY